MSVPWNISMLSSFVPIVVVLVAALIAAVTDVWKFKISNLLTLPLLLSGLIYHGYIGGLAGLGSSVVGVLFGFFVLLTFYLMGGMGAGDVKLLAAVGAWLGMPFTFYVFIASSLAAGVYAVALLAFAGGLSEVYINLHIMWLRVTTFGRHLAANDRVEAEVRRTDRRRRVIPFGAMVAVGVVPAYLWFIKSQGN